MKIRSITYIFFALLVLTSGLSATLSGKKICVDPGHGGSDPGATGVNGSTLPNEADLVLDIDQRFSSMLTGDSATVIMTRADDVAIELANRVAIANDNSVNIFVSTHLNSADAESAHGTETYAYQSGGNGEILATKIQNELIDHLARTDRGVKFASYYVIKYTNMPASLSEGLFVSNTAEFNLISQSDTRQEHAVALYHAVCSYYGVTPMDDPGTGEDPGNVKGFVYNATQGENVEGNRISGADCYLKKSGEADIHVTSSATGLFTFTGVTPGDYTLQIEKTGFTTASKSITVTSGADTWASTGIYESSAAGTAILKGFVFNESTGLGNVAENRIAGAACVLKNKTTNAEVTVNSDASGLFRFNDLDTGSYSLTISMTDFTTRTVDITIIEGENWASTGIFEEGAAELGSLTGTVTSADTSSPVANALCVLTSKTSGDPFSVSSDGTGTYLFENMMPDDYSLTVTADGFEPWTGDITIVSGVQSVKDVELEASETTQDSDTVTDSETISDNETEDSDISNTDNEQTDTDETPVFPDDETNDSGITTDADWADTGVEDETGCSCAVVGL